jgi:O-antigen/teichoic acid export membrane protein
VKNFFQSSLKYSGSAAILKVSQFSIFMWLAGQVSIEEYAAFGLLMALLQGIQSFSHAGVLEISTGIIAKQHNESSAICYENTSVRVFLILSILVSFIFLLFFILSVDDSVATNNKSVIAAIFTGVILGFSLMEAGLARLRENHTLSALLSIMPSLLGLSLGVVFFKLFASIDSFFLGYAIGSLSIALFFIRNTKIEVNIISGRESLIYFLKKTPSYLLIALLGWLSGYGANFIIGANFEAIEIAKFTFLLSYSSAILFLLGAPVQVWSPRFTQLYSRIPVDELENKNRNFFSLLSIFIGFTGGVLILLFPVMSALIGGNESFYHDLTLEVSLLLVGYLLLVPSWQVGGHILANSLGERLATSTLYSSFVGLIVSVLLMNTIGPVGIYIGFLIQMGIRSFFLVWFLRNRCKVRIDYLSMGIGIMMLSLGYILSIFQSNLLVAASIWLVLFLVAVIILKPRLVDLLDS